MAATPKHRGSKRRRNNRRSQPRHKATLPQLVTLDNNKRVPAHTVTEANPTYKGVKFFAGKKRKK